MNETSGENVTAPTPTLYKKMNYRDITDMNRRILTLLPCLPADVDVVVGIPRSGMLPAAILSLHLNCLLADVHGFLDGRVLANGPRYNHARKEKTAPRKILIVDDFVSTGAQLQQVKNIVQAASLPHEVFYASIFVAQKTKQMVDFFAEVLKGPTIFEWNLLHHDYFIPHGCVAMEDVLCPAPDPDELSSARKYEQFIAAAEPWFLPSQPIGWLVTERPQKYRTQTEAWLARHGVKYKQLIMREEQSFDAATFKAEIYTETDSVFFVEGKLSQAIAIADQTGKFVYCMETRELIQPKSTVRYQRIAKDAAPRFTQLIKKMCKQIIAPRA